MDASLEHGITPTQQVEDIIKLMANNVREHIEFNKRSNEDLKILANELKRIVEGGL